MAAAGLAALALLAGAWQQPTPATPQAQLDVSLPQRYTTLAADLNPSSGAASGLIEIVISRWSTDAEQSQLMGALAEKGPDEMLKVLKKQKPVGRLRTPGSIGQELQFSSQQPSRSGGRDIILLTDRIIDYTEFAGMARSVEYPFLYIELHLDAKSQGKGSLLPAAKLIPAGRLLVAENYNMVPISLGSVKREK